MNKELKSFGSFCGVILLVGFIYWTYHHNTNQIKQNNNVLNTNQTLQTADSGYADTYKSSFIESCNRSSNYTNINACTCMANKMVTTYTGSQLLDISSKYLKTGAIPNELLQAYNFCVGN